jgi:hypothetical protein
MERKSKKLSRKTPNKSSRSLTIRPFSRKSYKRVILYDHKFEYRFIDRIGKLKMDHGDKETFHMERDKLFYDFFKSISEDKFSPKGIKKISILLKNLSDDVLYS